MHMPNSVRPMRNCAWNVNDTNANVIVSIAEGIYSMLCVTITTLFAFRIHCIVFIIFPLSLSLVSLVSLVSFEALSSI